MKNKIEKAFKRLELADYLEKIAGELRKGTIETEGRQWSIPESIDAKIKHKEKKGRIETKLKWRWSTLSDYDPVDREEVTRWQDSFKTLKKQMATEYKLLEKAVAGGGYPGEAILEEFIKHSNEMARFADPEWSRVAGSHDRIPGSPGKFKTGSGKQTTGSGAPRDSGSEGKGEGVSP
jgi:amphi-Trp domain-containing protein